MRAIQSERSVSPAQAFELCHRRTRRGHLCHERRLGVQLHSRVIADIYPDVHVGRTTEVPDERGTLEAPAIPNLVLAQIVRGVEREIALVESTLLLETCQYFLA